MSFWWMRASITLVLATSTLAQGVPKSVVAVTGQVAAPGWVFDQTFRVAAIERDRVVFSASLSDGVTATLKVGVFEWSPTGLAPWLLPGQPIDGLAPGEYVSSFDGYTSTDRGGVLVGVASIRGPGMAGAEAAVLAVTPTWARVLARQNDELPGTGVMWQGESGYVDTCVGPDNSAAIQVGTGGGSRAIVHVPLSGSSSIAAHTGVTAPGFPLGTAITYLYNNQQWLADGSRVFHAETSAIQHAVYVDSPVDGRSLLFPGPSVIGFPNFSSRTHWVLGASAGPRVLLQAPIATGNPGYILDVTPQAARPIVVPLQPAPGFAGGRMGWLQGVIASDGQICVFGSVLPPAGTIPIGDGLWIDVAGALVPIFGHGWQVPDAAPGVIGFGTASTSNRAALQTGGRVIAAWPIQSPGSSGTPTWYIARLEDGSVMTVARPGEQVQLPSGGVRTVGLLSASISHQSDNGRPQQFAADGSFAFTARVSGASVAFALLHTVLPTGRQCDSTDFNRDGITPDVQDIHDFLTVFAGAPCPSAACGDADFNNDAIFPDIDDIAALIRVFGGGPCVE